MLTPIITDKELYGRRPEFRVGKGTVRRDTSRQSGFCQVYRGRRRRRRWQDARKDCRTEVKLCSRTNWHLPPLSHQRSRGHMSRVQDRRCTRSARQLPQPSIRRRPICLLPLGHHWCRTGTLSCQQPHPTSALPVLTYAQHRSLGHPSNQTVTSAPTKSRSDSGSTTKAETAASVPPRRSTSSSPNSSR